MLLHTNNVLPIIYYYASIIVSEIRIHEKAGNMELGKFEILEELGRGGFGIVYKARDKALKRLVAIKVLHPNLVNDPTFVARFRQEAQIAAQLDHPNLVPVYDFGESEGRYYIVMGYMPSGSLKELIKKEGALSKERALEILRQIGSGLAYAHSTGRYHRTRNPAITWVTPKAGRVSTWAWPSAGARQALR